MKHKWILVLLAMVLTVSALAGCAGKAQAPTEPSYVVVGTEPTEAPPVEVKMPEYTFTYSGDLKDVIVLKEVAEFSGLEFTVKLSSGEEHIFTLHYNTVEGDYVTMLEDNAGNKVPVAFQMAVIPEGLGEADANLFYRAQESVNEIAESLKLK